MPTRTFPDEDYKQAFLSSQKAGVSTGLDSVADGINAKALERALDIRKFEIELYWKRAAYFWTFIGATLAGFVAIQASQAANKDDLSVLLSNLGIVFSFAWVCVNRGSKYWQENWEYHVDMLEDAIQGPLYKVVLARRAPQKMGEKFLHVLTGPAPISVSKVNQLISWFVTAMWTGLLWYSLPPFRHASTINWYYAGMILLTVTVCIAFLVIARTYGGGYWHQATIRTALINNHPAPR